MSTDKTRSIPLTEQEFNNIYNALELVELINWGKLREIDIHDYDDYLGRYIQQLLDDKNTFTREELNRLRSKLNKFWEASSIQDKDKLLKITREELLSLVLMFNNETFKEELLGQLKVIDYLLHKFPNVILSEKGLHEIAEYLQDKLDIINKEDNIRLLLVVVNYLPSIVVPKFSSHENS